MAITNDKLNTSFEAGDPLPETFHECCAHSIVIGSEGDSPGDVPVGDDTFPAPRDGTRLVRFLVKNGDDPPFGSSLRAEHHHEDHTPNGGRAWYGFSIWIPSNYQQDIGEGNFRIIHQFHDNNVSPIYAIHLNTEGNGNVFIRRKDGNTGSPFTDFIIDSAANLADQWLDFVVSARWSQTTVGRITYWMNGTVIHSESNTATLRADSSNTYSKRGIYSRSGGLMYGDWYRTFEVDDDDDYYDDAVAPSAVAATERTATPVGINLSQEQDQVLSWIGHSTSGLFSNVTSASVTPHADTEVGDRLMAVVRLTAPGPPTVTPPADLSWETHSADDGTDARGVVFVSESLSSVPGSLTFDFSGNSHGRITCSTLRGGGAVDFGTWGSAPGDTTADTTAGSMAVGSDRSQLLSVWTGESPTAGEYTPPGGTDKLTAFGEGFHNHIVIGLDEALVDSGASGDRTATMAAATDPQRFNTQLAFPVSTPSGAGARVASPVAMNIAGSLERTATDVRLNVEHPDNARTATPVAINLDAPRERTATPVAINVSTSGHERTASPVAIDLAAPTTETVYPPAGWSY